MSETKRILDMLEQGKITSEEAMALINALEEPVQISSESQVRGAKKSFKILKIVVFVEKDDVNVNIGVPVGVIKILGNIAQNSTKYIPQSAQEAMKSKGVTLEDIDIQGLLAALETGAEYNPVVIDVDMVDPEDGRITVKIFFD